VSFGLALVGVSPSPGSRVGTASRGCRCPMCSCGPSPASLRGKLQLHLHPWLPRRASSCSASAARAGRRGSAPPAARKPSCSPMPFATCCLRGEPQPWAAQLRHVPCRRPLLVLLPPAGHGMVGGEGRAFRISQGQ
jgi:hypothetical protein